MLGYYVLVPNMTVPQLQAFVRNHMPSQKELLRRARLAGAPNECNKCYAGLDEFVSAYEKIPSDDLTIRFHADERGAQCAQLASGGGCACRVIKEKLRTIVQRHVVRSLRASGYKCRMYTA